MGHKRDPNGATNRTQKGTQIGPKGNPNGATNRTPKGTQIGPKRDPHGIQKEPKWGHQWDPKGTQMGPPMGPQNRSTNGPLPPALAPPPPGSPAYQIRGGVVQQPLQPVIGQPVAGHAHQAALQLLPEELPEPRGRSHAQHRLHDAAALRVLQRSHQRAESDSQSESRTAKPPANERPTPLKLPPNRRAAPRPRPPPPNSHPIGARC